MTIHRFDGTDGGNPMAGLIRGTDGALYGTTLTGGVVNGEYFSGTVFKIDTDGAALTTLHNFTSGDGTSLFAGLIQAADGYLYGTTSDGGANNYGTLFRIGTDAAGFSDAARVLERRRRKPFRERDPGRERQPVRHDLARRGVETRGTIFEIDTAGAALQTAPPLRRRRGDPDRGPRCGP